MISYFLVLDLINSCMCQLIHAGEVINNPRTMEMELDNDTNNTAKDMGANGVCLPSLCFKPVLCWCCNGIVINCHPSKSECKKNC